MKTIAIYNLKGGVGKTSMSVNLAALSASQSARRTVLWDLDPQGATSWLAGDKEAEPGQAMAIFDRTSKLAKLPRKSRIAGVDLIAADDSLREIAAHLDETSGRHRLEKLIATLEKSCDRLILDCAPGLDTLTDQILRAADIVIVPIIPSPLSERAFGEVVTHIRGTFKKKETVLLLPVFSMVDRRRSRHKAALEENPEWPVIPMASVVELMAERRGPLFDFAKSSPAAQAYRHLWQSVERKLADAESD